MPHCVVEYAEEIENKVDIKGLINKVYQGALSSGLFEAHQIKTRALPYKHYLTADAKEAFIHVTVSILCGRTASQKQQLSQLVMQQLQTVELSPITMTVDIRDLDRDCYAKHVVSNI